MRIILLLCFLVCMSCKSVVETRDKQVETTVTEHVFDYSFDVSGLGKMPQYQPNYEFTWDSNTVVFDTIVAQKVNGKVKSSSVKASYNKSNNMFRVEYSTSPDTVQTTKTLETVTLTKEVKEPESCVKWAVLALSLIIVIIILIKKFFLK